MDIQGHQVPKTTMRPQPRERSSWDKAPWPLDTAWSLTVGSCQDRLGTPQTIGSARLRLGFPASQVPFLSPMPSPGPQRGLERAAGTHSTKSYRKREQMVSGRKNFFQMWRSNTKMLHVGYLVLG